MPEYRPTAYRLDIGGPKGNAFYLIGTIQKNVSKEAAKELGRCSSYEELLRKFKEYLPMVELYSSYELSEVSRDLYIIDNSTVEL